MGSYVDIITGSCSDWPRDDSDRFTIITASHFSPPDADLLNPLFSPLPQTCVIFIQLRLTRRP